MAQKETVYFCVSGRVQGVGFRAFVEKQARRLKLGGYVRNTADGRVEGVACGSQTDLSEFKEQLERGPSLAHVSAVTMQSAPPFDEPDFQIVP
ncbi:MAG: acylphosphatase [Spirochaetales bacterium]|nr:acylphosphatase [Spirochaetales bacterium]